MTTQTLLLINKEELSEIIREQITELVRTLSANVQTPIDPNGSELLTRHQAAQYLHITLPTSNAWTQQGTIKAVRVQSRVYYSKAELQRLSK
jgi:excisionase family DNA binding protein